MLLLFWSSTAGPSAAAPSIRLRMTAVANPFGTATPSITLRLSPVLGTQPAQATPSITLGLTILARQPAQTSPSIRLALAPVLASQPAQASPSITLALAPHAIGGIDVAGSTVIELEYNATGSTITNVHRIDYEQTGVSTIILGVRD